MRSHKTFKLAMIFSSTSISLQSIHILFQSYRPFEVFIKYHNKSAYLSLAEGNPTSIHKFLFESFHMDSLAIVWVHYAEERLWCQFLSFKLWSEFFKSLRLRRMYLLLSQILFGITHIPLESLDSNYLSPPSLHPDHCLLYFKQLFEALRNFRLCAI